ncbi:MAG: substrate-binding periplasmic protein [Puniceicoccales bacterium]
MSFTTTHRFTHLLTGVLAALTAFLFSGCQSTSNVDTLESTAITESSPNVLRVGVSANMPPFVFEQDGQLSGLEVDFAIALADELGMKVRFVKKNWEDLIPALRNNKIDIIMSGMNYNPERAAIIAFANPYVRSGQKALVLQKNASKYPIAGFILQTKEPVGAEAGTTGAYLIESSFPKTSLKAYRSAQKGAEAVINGDIELFIHDAPTTYWMAGLYQNRGLTVAPPVLTQDLMCWGINRENTALLSQVNTILAQWSSTGAIDAILTRWVQL